MSDRRADSDVSNEAASSEGASFGLSAGESSGPPTWWTIGVAFLLFVIWSNTFIGIGYLLGAEQVGARFDWMSLTTARFAPVFPFCVIYCLMPHRREQTFLIVRRHWRRLIASGLLCVVGYNSALDFGQQHGVPAPVASVMTTLAPIFILVLSILFLGERLTRRRAIGFAFCIVGMGVISFARGGDVAGTYPLIVATTAMAPFSWSVYSVLTKPLMRTVDPIHWTYLTIAFGSLPLMIALPWVGGPEMIALDRTGWAWLLYLAVLATVVGFAVWNWLLRYLPASTVGLTVFFNPPLTTISKVILAATLPATFAFKVTPLEGVGGAIVLLGLGIGVLQGAAKHPGAK